jgi:hypothetical protein
MLAGYNPFDMGRIYMDLLEDHCLIKPTMRDIHGSMLCFKIHDIVCNLGIQIVEEEEGFYYHVGKDLTALPENACGAHLDFVEEQKIEFPYKIIERPINMLMVNE